MTAPLEVMMKKARIEGDYEPGRKFSEQDAALRIAHAEEFIAVAEEKL